MWDAIVIGGGVVGCAVFRALSISGYKTLLIERNPHLVGGVSANNTGIACTYEDTDPSSLEFQLLKLGNSINEETYKELGLPYSPTGALYIAYNKTELETLKSLLKQRKEKGDNTSEIVDKEKLNTLSLSKVNPNALGALFIKKEITIEPWMLPISCASHGMDNGGEIKLSCNLKKATFINENKDKKNSSSYWDLETTNGSFKGKVVLNCTGLWVDEVENLIRPSPITIMPRRGDYVVFERFPNGWLPVPIGHCPTPTSRGVYIWQTLHGNIICGPTAESQQSKVNSPPTNESINSLISIARNSVPALLNANVIGSYSGLRPGTQKTDYHIEVLPEKNWVLVGGIRSTGVTGSLGIANYVLKLVETNFSNLKLLNQNQQQQQQYVPPKKFPPLKDIYKSFVKRNDGSVEINGRVFFVSHNVSKFGMNSWKNDPSISAKL